MPTLYDHRGNPIDRSALRREQAAPTLTGIRTIWSESVASGLTPARLARILRDAVEGDATDYLILAEEMEERDLHYASVLSTRKRAVAGIDPTVEAASDDARDVEIADAVRGLVRAPEFPGLVTDLLDALGKGYSACEIIWDRTDSRWTPREYLWRDPRFFVFDRASMQRLRLLDEGASFEGRELPPYKFLVHIPKLKSGIPIRSGVARLAAAAYMCKTFTVSDWMAFAEVFGMPLRVGRYGPNATDRDIQTLIRAVANLGTDAACVLPDSMRIEFQEAAKAAGGPELFPRLAEWLDRQVSKGVLGQTMTSDDGSSQAQANVHDDVRLDIRKDDARQVAATIDRDLVRPFVDLNWGPPKNGYPRVLLQVAEPEDIAALADALAKLVPLGGLGIQASVVRDRLGFPDPEEGAVLLGEEQGVGQDAAANRRREEFARGRNRAGAMPDADAELAELAEDALAEWEPLLAPVINPVLELAGKCGSYDEFLAGLPGLVNGEAGGGMNTDALVRSLAEAAFKARGLGDGGDQ